MRGTGPGHTHMHIHKDSCMELTKEGDVQQTDHICFHHDLEVWLEAGHFLLKQGNDDKTVP